MAAMVVGAVVIVGTMLTIWLGGSSDDKASEDEDLAGSYRAPTLDTGIVKTEKPGKSASKDVNSLLAAGGSDPFAGTTSDGKLHKVVIRFTSDGAMYAGWRYRSKGGDGLQVGNRTLEVSKTVRGPLPVGQAAVQVLQTASYATCSIIVDGIVVTTQTAKGVNHVTVCVG